LLFRLVASLFCGAMAVHAERFAPLPESRVPIWNQFREGMKAHFPGFVGLVLEEVRTDYARMRLPFREELKQPAGVVHGGAIATLIDTVVVPAIGSGYDEPRPLFTIDMHVQYLDPLIGEDAIAEAWIEKRGRSTVFCRVEVRASSGTLVSTGTLVYKVGSGRLAPAPAR
jgi:uncharacterized protein (TIGR00369 family)